MCAAVPVEPHATGCLADACASPSTDKLGDLSKEADQRIKDEVR